MSMVSGVDAESDGPRRPSNFYELKRVFKRFDEGNDGKISDIEILGHLKAAGLSVESADIEELNSEEQFTEWSWSEPSHARTDHVEKLIDLQADWAFCKIETKSWQSSYYHNRSFWNNVDYANGCYRISSMKREAGRVREQYCIVDIPESGDMINNEDDKMKKNYKWGFMAPVAEQAVAGVLANRIAAAGSGANNASGVLHFMEIGIVLALSFKLAGVALKGSRRPNLPIWMGKIGDVLTGITIIMSLGMHLPPVMAYSAGPLASILLIYALIFA